MPSWPTNTETIPQATTDAAERLAWLALALVPGIGARRMAALLSRFGSAGGVLQAPPSAFAGMTDITQPIVTGIRSATLDDAVRTLATAERLGQVIAIPADAAYPQALRSIPDPPTVLWMRGDAALLVGSAVAIVGSRDHSGYGAEVARMLAEAAARSGVVVVSGMARGLDAVAHAAALDAGGGSIGVLGHGADGVYPRVNLPLFRRMIAEGLLLTEHPPGERAHAGAFPRRNRLISGLARAIVVVEAAPGSGTLITVSMALEQGRDVLAVPGPITSPLSVGTNRLIRDGATPVLEAADLLAALGLIAATPSAAAGAEPPMPTLSPVEAQVFDALSAAGRHVDEIAARTGVPIGTLLGTLLGLELGGCVEQAPVGLYRRKARG